METKLLEALTNIQTDIAVIKVDLNHHIRRTEINEENLKLMRNELKPVAKHVIMMEGILKFFGVVSVLVGIALGIMKLIEI